MRETKLNTNCVCDVSGERKHPPTLEKQHHHSKVIWVCHGGQHWSWLSVCLSVCLLGRSCPDSLLTSSGRSEPAGARSRPPSRAGSWPLPRRRGRSWCWWGRPGTGSACSSGPLCCCCCCGASALWASSGSWSGSLKRDLKSFFPGWTRQKRRRRRRKRRRGTPRTEGGTPSRPRGSKPARPLRSGPRPPSGRRTGGPGGTGRGAGTGWRSVCTGPRAAAGSSGTTACCVLWDRRSRKDSTYFTQSYFISLQVC